ncbi:MAG: hypothetical protein COB78_05870 [Hyphomicrobiales bacterium]|nr:MAG: hypothetical protein COB78_05870 [Hyphomicrobiales bacterium]
MRDPIVQSVIEVGRIISVEDEAMISELRTRWLEARAQLKIVGQSGVDNTPEFNAKIARLEILRSACHRLQALSECDHRKLYGEVCA